MMADDEAGFEIDNSEPTAPGERLRAAREAKGLSIDDVCAATRIPKRHLETIEDGDFAVLPGRTYAIGFSRSYAKAVGLNDEEIVNEVREQRLRDGTMQTEDPTRLPSRGLVFGSIIAAVVLLAGLFAFSRTFFDAGAEPASLLAEQDQRDLAQEQAAAVATESASAQPAASGPVVFTSTEDGMWVRFYDGDESNVIMEKLMSKGETYTIPDTARDPKVRTGRPDAFAITVGGKSVPPLAKEDQVMSDVEVSAEALLARDGTSAADAEGATE